MSSGGDREVGSKKWWRKWDLTPCSGVEREGKTLGAAGCCSQGVVEAPSWRPEREGVSVDQEARSGESWLQAAGLGDLLHLLRARRKGQVFRSMQPRGPLSSPEVPGGPWKGQITSEDTGSRGVHVAGVMWSKDAGISHEAEVEAWAGGRLPRASSVSFLCHTQHSWSQGRCFINVC